MLGPNTVAARRMVKRAVIQGGLEAVSLLSRTGFMARARGLGAIFTLHHVRPACHKDFDPAAHLTITPEFSRCEHHPVEARRPYPGGAS